MFNTACSNASVIRPFICNCIQSVVKIVIYLLLKNYYCIESKFFVYLSAICQSFYNIENSIKKSILFLLSLNEFSPTFYAKKKIVKSIERFIILLKTKSALSHSFYHSCRNKKTKQNNDKSSKLCKQTIRSKILRLDITQTKLKLITK